MNGRSAQVLRKTTSGALETELLPLNAAQNLRKRFRFLKHQIQNVLTFSVSKTNSIHNLTAKV